MLLANDILTRKTPDGTTVWISQRLVVEKCGVDAEYLRRKCRYQYMKSLPASWQKVADRRDFFLGRLIGRSWRWGRRNGQYYYDLDTIPNRKPRRYRDLFPSKKDLISQVDEQRLCGSRYQQSELREQLVRASFEYSNEEDVRWLQKSSDARPDISVCRDYGKALGWCRFIKAALRSGAHEAYGCPSVSSFYEACAGAIGSQKLSGLRISTGRSLRNKLSGFPSDVSDQRQWIISGKYGNINRKIVGAHHIVDTVTGEIHKFDIHQAIMYQAYMNMGDTRKEYRQTLYDKVYVPAMESFGETPISLRTFNSHLSRFCCRLQTSLHRYGEDWYKKHILTYIPAAKLSYGHSLFCGDGSGLVGYKYWKPVTKKGKTVYELHVRNLYATLISDVASGYIAGHAFSAEGSSTETSGMTRQAVRMAVESGGRQTMFEFVSDNHGSYTESGTREFLRGVFNVVRTIEAGNSQANPAEVMFRLFKNSTLRSRSNFIRSSHYACDPENLANIDNITKEKYPTYTEAILQIREAIDQWNNTPRGNGLTPRQMFMEHKHPECRPMSATQLRDIMGHHTRVEVTRMRGFVEVMHAGRKSLFEIPDYQGIGSESISKATGHSYDAHVCVRWDDTGADLYSADGKYILTCPPAPRAGMSHAELTDEQRAGRHLLSQRKALQLESAVAFGDDVTSAAEALYSGAGYGAGVALGENKESYNDAREEELNAMIPNKPATEKRRKAAKQEPAKYADPKQDAINVFLGNI